MKRRASPACPSPGPTGNSSMDTFDLTIVHCNANCGAIQQLQPTVAFFFTSCGHVICAKCKTSAGVQCPVCRAQLRVMELSPSMEQNIKSYFEASTERLGQEVFRSVSEKISKFRQILKFQNNQRMNLNKLFGKMFEKLESVCKEKASLEEKLKEAQNEIQMLQRRLQLEIDKAARPTAMISPEMNKRVSFQPRASAPSNNVQYLPQANFRTPVVVETRNQRQYDTPLPAHLSTPKQSQVSLLSNLGRPMLNSLQAQRSNVYSTQPSNPQQATSGLAAFRGNSATKPAAATNWSPSSVSSYNYTRRY